MAVVGWGSTVQPCPELVSRLTGGRGGNTRDVVGGRETLKKQLEKLWPLWGVVKKMYITLQASAVVGRYLLVGSPRTLKGVAPRIYSVSY